MILRASRSLSSAAGMNFCPPKPGFTDISARLPALRLLLVVALIAAVLFIVNIFRRGWTLAFVSVGAWIVVAIAAGTLYPAVIQRFSVLPDQLMLPSRDIAG